MVRRAFELMVGLPDCEGEEELYTRCESRPVISIGFVLAAGKIRIESCT